MKEWALNTFGDANIANNFEEEEIDGNILLSSTVQTTEAMEKLGLTTIGKKGKFLQTVGQLTGKRMIQNFLGAGCNIKLQCTVAYCFFRLCIT